MRGLQSIAALLATMAQGQMLEVARFNERNLPHTKPGNRKVTKNKLKRRAKK